MKEEKIQHNFPAIIGSFRTSDSYDAVIPHGSGHIHDTFRVRNHDPAGPDYLLQRINHRIFQNVPALMENIERVTSFLRRKLAAIPGADPDREVLTLIPTHSGTSFYQDAGGDFWRMYLFIKDTNSYDVVQTPEQAYQGGKAFGRFQALLAELPGDTLHQTIPNFHNVEKRLQTFREIVRQDPVGRAGKVEAEIASVEERAEEMGAILSLAREGKMPLRITHNDTKFNNVLLDRHDQAQCVIDLDTVMPGYVPYDFGDAIRTTASTAAEDEKDLSQINLNVPLYEAYAKGYLTEAGGFLTDTEAEYLAFGCKHMAYSQMMRFLTDYIAGDTYYKIHSPEHNLQRTRAQLQLLVKIEELYPTLQTIIHNLRKSIRQTAG